MCIRDRLKSNLNNNSDILINNKRIVAGDKQNIYLKKNTVSRIFTGAKMPLNSKTVVMQENVKLFSNKLRINKLPKYGENCRLKGEDIKKGQKILEKGEKIKVCLLYTSPSPRDRTRSRMPSSA